MRTEHIIIAILGLIILVSCGSKKKIVQEYTSADEIVNRMIAVHGGAEIEEKRFEFMFRKGQYSFRFNTDRSYYYESIKTKDQDQFKSILTNKFFEYYKNNEIVELTDKKANGLSNSLNSVIYFASLPYKLKDDAVFKKKLLDQDINGESYYQIEVTFSEEGGGSDFDDVFHYWINKKTFEMDYVAYVYHTGKGGVRFRTAFNKNRVEGVLFQDYKNYKAPKNTPLNQLPALFQKGELELLSEIKTENVRRIDI